MRDENRIATEIVKSAIRVHKELGPGLLESAYQKVLSHLLIDKGYIVELEKPQPILFEGKKIEAGYRLDMLVNDKVIVELKTVEEFNKVHLAQVITYLKLSQCKLGLLLNFNVRLMKHGIKRVVL